MHYSSRTFKLDITQTSQIHNTTKHNTHVEEYNGNKKNQIYTISIHPNNSTDTIRALATTSSETFFTITATSPADFRYTYVLSYNILLTDNDETTKNM